MRMRKMISAILSFVMVFTLFGGAMTTSAATRHYFASTLYFTMYEQTNSPKYSGYNVDYMEMATADTGFNHMTIMISFPWLQGLHQKDGYVDKTRLEGLDRVIALCMKYDMHVTFTNSETPGISMWGEDEHEKGAENLAKPGMAKTYAGYWGMLAKRYKGIDNKYLAFNLMVEPEFTSEEQYEKLLGPSVEAIFAVDKSRVVIADIHSWGLTGEAMAKMGVALSHHHYEPRNFCVLEGTDYEQDKDYLHSVKWEQTAKDTFDLHSDGDENIASLNDVRKTAEKWMEELIAKYGEPQFQIIYI